MTDPVYVSGDVVYGADPFRTDGGGRPWLVVANHEGRPFHGEQYIALALTTRSWLDGLVPVEEWVRGGTPAESRIVPWGVQSLAAADIDRWQGRVARRHLTDAVEGLIDCLPD